MGLPEADSDEFEEGSDFGEDEDLDGRDDDEDDIDPEDEARDVPDQDERDSDNSDEDDGEEQDSEQAEAKAALAANTSFISRKDAYGDNFKKSEGAEPGLSKSYLPCTIFISNLPARCSQVCPAGTQEEGCQCR